MLRAGCDVFDAVTLILECAAISACESLPTIVQTLFLGGQTVQDDGQVKEVGA